MNFVLLYPEMRNIDLIKDVGMIPNTLRTQFNFDSKIVCIKNEDFIHYRDINNVEIQYLNVKHTNSKLDIFVASCLYLIKNSKNIDILQLYHPVKSNFIWLKIFRHFNKLGKVYLKLDADDRIVNSVKGKHSFFHYAKRKMIYALLTEPEYVTVESSMIQKKIEDYYNIRISILQNGFQDNYPVPDIIIKQDIMLNVARLGTYQKGTDILLEAFSQSAINHGWKLVLIGSIEESFKTYLRHFFQENTELEGRVIFKPEEFDRARLFEEFEKASLFILPSRFESFGIVLAEALSRGCYLVTTDAVPSGEDIIKDTTFGCIVRNEQVSELAQVMEDLWKKREWIGLHTKERIICAKSRYSWNVICKKIDQNTKKNEMVLVDYIGNCDLGGKPIGHPVKILNEYGKLLTNFNVMYCVPRETLKLLSSNHAILLSNSISPYSGHKVEKVVQRFQNLHRAFTRTGNKCLWFCNIDFCFFLYVFIFRPQRRMVCTLYSYDSTATGIIKRLKNYIIQSSLKKMKLVIKSSDTFPIKNVPCVFAPDYLFFSEQYGKYQKKEKKEQIVCVGTMSKNKNLQKVINVFREIDYPLLIIGYFDDKELYYDLIKKKTSNVEIVDTYLSEEEYLTILSEARYSLLPYNMNLYTNRTSGVLLESVFVHTIPIAANNCLETHHIAGIGFSHLEELKKCNFQNINTESIYKLYDNYIAERYCFEKIQAQIQEKLKKI